MEKAVAAPGMKKGRRDARRWLFMLGMALLGLAALALIYEVIATASTGGYRTIAAGEFWFRLHPYSLNLSQAVVQRYLSPGLWDPVIVSLLQWPVWSILGAPGAILAILFHHRTKNEG